MVAKILCVAEKPSIAKAVANHLAGGHARASDSVGNNKYVKNYEFDYNFPNWGRCQVVFTSVLGHLHSSDFESRYRSWNSCRPEMLFQANIVTFVSDDKKGVARNIEYHARSAGALFIWTDCDREGEHIGSEIRAVAVAANPRLKQPGNISRAHFSNTERQHVIQAARNPVELDDRQANAVNARIELDLRIGASFTRMQTLNLKSMVDRFDPDIKALSYGSCQFPTLGFVIDRYFQVQNFVPEPFWSIIITHLKGGINVKFNWSRSHLFDRTVVVLLFERCLASKISKVAKVQTKPTSKWKPLPLTTVELQKMGSRFLRMDSKTVMTAAESLYQKGFISYPRTETDQFDKGMDITALVNRQTQSEAWGQYAQRLVDGGFSQPRNGRNNDKAHPPIHPVNFVVPANLNTDQERRVHEFVVRRFLACCSQDATGSRSEVEISYGSETFRASGLMVLERNYLDVYPYEKWTSTEQLPDFHVNETFEPREARLTEGKTSKPSYLTEPDLIGLMDANGIGTDATMHEHIAKIKERNYTETRTIGRGPNIGGSDGEESDGPATRGRGRGRAGGGRGGRGSRTTNAQGDSTAGPVEFIPTTLGVALYEGYEKMGFETSLTKPFLRKQMEMKMKAICDGHMTKSQVVDESLTLYKDLYFRSVEQLDILKASFRKYVHGEEPRF